MKKTLAIFATIIITVLLSGCASQKVVVKKKTYTKPKVVIVEKPIEKYPNFKVNNSVNFLSAKEIRDLYVGHTIYGKNLKYNNDIEIKYLENKTFIGKVANKIKVFGVWYIQEDGTKCTKRKTMSKTVQCNKIYKEGDYYVEAKGYQKILKVKVK